VFSGTAGGTRGIPKGFGGWDLALPRLIYGETVSCLGHLGFADALATPAAVEAECGKALGTLLLTPKVTG